MSDGKPVSTPDRCPVHAFPDIALSVGNGGPMNAGQPIFLGDADVERLSDMGDAIAAI
jgi:hypothetical protein